MAEWQDGFSHQSRWHWWRTERTARGRWLLSLCINRADFLLRQLCTMAYSKLSLFTRLIVRSGRRAFSAAHRLSGSSSFSLRGPTFPIVFPIFYHIGIHVTRESFFCEVTLELSYCKSCLVNNLPFVPKEYSSRQTCLCCHLRTSESRKIFPSLEAEWLW